MPPNHKSESDVLRVEEIYRDAFNRLREGNPRVLGRGAAASQNNVAREAGKDPSAFKKSRYPELIREIQAWNLNHQRSASPASIAKKDKERRNRTNREALLVIKKERDLALSMLVEADTVILQLRQEIDSLKKQLEPKNKK